MLRWALLIFSLYLAVSAAWHPELLDFYVLWLFWNSEGDARHDHILELAGLARHPPPDSS